MILLVPYDEGRVRNTVRSGFRRALQGAVDEAEKSVTPEEWEHLSTPEQVVPASQLNLDLIREADRCCWYDGGHHAETPGDRAGGGERARSSRAKRRGAAAGGCHRRRETIEAMMIDGESRGARRVG